MLTTKTFDLKALDVDESSRRVKVAIAETESVDRDNELIHPKAFNQTISRKGPKGTNEVWHLIDHNPSLETALGKFSELYMEGKYLVGVSEYKDSWLWREVAWPLYKGGDINQHSIGFRVIGQKEKADGYDVIKEVELYEGSAVLWGANPNTPVLDVAKSLYKEKQESFEDRIEWIVKSLRDGKYNGECQSLLILELQQLYKFRNEAEKALQQTEEVSAPAADELNAAAIYAKMLTIKIH
jgi:HK97 family phage prohead protease